MPDLQGNPAAFPAEFFLQNGSWFVYARRMEISTDTASRYG